jgi:hypothetical protein
MSDVDPQNHAEFVNEEGPGCSGERSTPAGRERPEHEAHGGSMAPGMVDDVGRQTVQAPPGTPEPSDG